MILFISGCLGFVPRLCYADFEDMGCGTRAMGMGNAFLSISDDIGAIYYNPAGLGQLQSWEFASSYSRLHWGLDDGSQIDNSFIGYAQPIKIKSSKKNVEKQKETVLKTENRFSDWGTIGFGWLNLNLSSLYSEDIFFVSYGRDMADLARRLIGIESLWMGINLKLLGKKYGKTIYSQNALDDDLGMVTGEVDPVFSNKNSKEGFSTDMGLLYKFGRNYLGLAVTDINQPDMGLKEEEKVPVGLKVGVAYREEEFNLALDIGYKNRDLNVYTGVEKWFSKERQNLFGLRMGLGIGSRQYRSASIGASYKVTPFFQFDYAFIYPMSGVKQTYGTHRVSLVLRRWKGIQTQGELTQRAERKSKISKSGRISKAEKKKRKEAISKLFLQGVDFYQRGKLLEAINCWERVLRELPSHKFSGKYLKVVQEKLSKKIEEFYRQGERYYKQGQWAKAIDEWKSILKLKSTEELAEKKIKMLKENLDKHFNLGDRFYNKGDYGKAMKEWEQILSRYPEYPQIEDRIQNARVKIKKEMGISKRKKIIKEYIKQGTKYYKEEKYIMAVNEWKKALELDAYQTECLKYINQVIDLYLQRGLQLYKTNKYKKAIEAWREILKIQPWNNKIKELIKKAKKERIEKVEMFYKKGTKKYNEGDYTGALSWWEKGLQKIPGNIEMRKLCIEAYLMQGIMDYREGRLDAAIKHWKKVLKLASTHKQVLRYLKRARTKKRKLEELGNKG